MKKTALITGGTRGIGYGIALQLADHGFDLALNGIRLTEEVSGALEELKTKGSDVIYIQGDIANTADRERILAQTKAHFNQLNILVNNAGMAPRERRDVLETTEESFDEVISVNLKGPYFLTQHVARWMIEQKNADPSFQACIINVSSVSATMASINRGEYCISKAGIAMTTKLFAVKLGEFGIPVYEVRPGIISTDMTAAVKEKYDKLLLEDGLAIEKRWGTPDDVGKVVAALATGIIPYSTGQVIMTDGGLTIPRL
jgi:NAD(P)-dependent dehydrogenase (short-subunit alcohol dehydrogenase family)